MTISNSPLSYSDCYERMDVALADAKGCRFRINKPTFDTAYAEATFLRMRMHQARKLDRDRNAKIYPDPSHPMHNGSMYDQLTLRIKSVDGAVYLYMEKTMVDVSDSELLSEVPEIEYTPVPEIETQPQLQIEGPRVEISI